MKDFCTATLNTIQPELVLVTGDLTDAKDKTRFRSKQYEQEWISYQNVIKNSKVAQKYKWIDIRGNHGKMHFGSAMLKAVCNIQDILGT